VSGTELAICIVLGVLGLGWYFGDRWFDLQESRFDAIREDARKERERMEREK
jgi:hypothetical protein